MSHISHVFPVREPNYMKFGEDIGPSLALQ